MLSESLFVIYIIFVVTRAIARTYNYRDTFTTSCRNSVSQQGIPPHKLHSTMLPIHSMTKDFQYQVS